MRYQDITLSMTGDVASRRTHESAELVRPAVDMMAALIGDGQEAFSRPIPHDAVSHLVVHWTPAGPGAVMMTIAAGELPGGQMLATSVLLAGLDAQAERKLLMDLQRALTNRVRDQGVETAFDLLGVTARPVIVSIPWGGLPADLAMAGDLETCIAAAYFERVCGD